MSEHDKVSSRMITFTLGGMVFEYDGDKNQKNVAKHGISFPNAARVTGTAQKNSYPVFAERIVSL